MADVGKLAGFALGSASFGVIVSLINNVRKPASLIQRDFELLGKKIGISQRAMDQFAHSTQSALRFLATLSVSMAVVGKFASDFQREISGIAAILGRSTVESIDQLRQAAIDLSKEFPTTATHVAEGMRFLAQAGLGMNEIISITPEVIALAQSTMESFELSASLVVKTISSLQLGFDDTTRVVNSLQFAVNKSINTLQSLNNALKFSAPFARSLGIELEDLLSIIIITANAGIEAGIAGRSIGQAFQQVAKGGQRLAKGVTELVQDIQLIINTGGTAADITRRLDREFGNLSESEVQALEATEDLSDAEIELIENTGSLLGATDRLQKLISVFGVRGARIFGLLLGQADDLDFFRHAMEVQVISAADQAAVAMDNLGSKVTLAMNQIKAGILQSGFAQSLEKVFDNLTEGGADSAFSKLGDTIGKLVGDMGTKLAPALEDITSSLTRLIEVLAGPLSSAFDGATFAIKSFASIIEGMPAPVAKVLGFLFVMEKTFGGVSAVTGILGKGLLLVTLYMGKTAVATGVATATTGALTASQGALIAVQRLLALQLQQMLRLTEAMGLAVAEETGMLWAETDAVLANTAAWQGNAGAKTGAVGAGLGKASKVSKFTKGAALAGAGLGLGILAAVDIKGDIDQAKSESITKGHILGEALKSGLTAGIGGALLTGGNPVAGVAAGAAAFAISAFSQTFAAKARKDIPPVVAQSMQEAFASAHTAATEAGFESGQLFSIALEAAIESGADNVVARAFEIFARLKGAADEVKEVERVFKEADDLPGAVRVRVPISVDEKTFASTGKRIGLEISKGITVPKDLIDKGQRGARGGDIGTFFTNEAGKSDFVSDKQLKNAKEVVLDGPGTKLSANFTRVVDDSALGKFLTDELKQGDLVGKAINKGELSSLLLGEGKEVGLLTKHFQDQLKKTKFNFESQGIFFDQDAELDNILTPLVEQGIIPPEFKAIIQAQLKTHKTFDISLSNVNGEVRALLTPVNETKIGLERATEILTEAGVNFEGLSDEVKIAKATLIDSQNKIKGAGIEFSSLGDKQTVDLATLIDKSAAFAGANTGLNDVLAGLKDGAPGTPFTKAGAGSLFESATTQKFTQALSETSSKLTDYVSFLQTSTTGAFTSLTANANRYNELQGQLIEANTQLLELAREGVAKSREALSAPANSIQTFASFISANAIELGLSGKELFDAQSKLTQAMLFQQFSALATAREQADLAILEKDLVTARQQVQAAHVQSIQAEIASTETKIRADLEFLLLTAQNAEALVKESHATLELSRIKLKLAKVMSSFLPFGGGKDFGNLIAEVDKMQLALKDASAVVSTVQSAFKFTGSAEEFGKLLSDVNGRKELINKFMTTLEGQTASAAQGAAAVNSIVNKIVDRGNATNAEIKELANVLGVTVDSFRGINLLEMAKSVQKVLQGGQRLSDIVRNVNDSANPLGDALTQSAAAMVSMGFSAAKVGLALEQFQRIQFLSGVLGFLENFQGLAGAIGATEGFSKQILEVQNQIFNIGKDFLGTLLDLTDAKTLSEIFARQNFVEQNINNRISLNLQAEINLPEGVTADQREEIVQIALDAVNEAFVDAAAKNPF